MRLVSWNLHGATVPGRATVEQQHGAWSYIRDLGADIVLAQEVGSKGIPGWANDEWTIIKGENGVCGKDWHWGSVIAARPGLNLRLRADLLADPWLTRMYDLVLIAEIELPGGIARVASVHAPVEPVRTWLSKGKLSLTGDETASLRRPGCPDEPYYNDFAFTTVARHVAGGRFVVSGDWNNCRRFDTAKSRAGSAFFERASARGWRECHRGPIEPSYLGRRGTPTYQLDHAFADEATAARVTSCRVVIDDEVRAVSDHAPLVVEFGA